MSIASKLTDEQKSKLAEWAVEGIGLSGIQKRVEEEFGFRMTYMDTRFLALDLGLEVKEPGDDDDDAHEHDQAVSEEPGQESGVPDAPDAPSEIPQGAGNVSVSIDDLVIPGAVVSGKVTFSDGKGAAWMIDNMGRFGIEPDEAGYRPGDADMQSFQQQLSEMMRKKGY